MGDKSFSFSMVWVASSVGFGVIQKPNENMEDCAPVNCLGGIGAQWMYEGGRRVGTHKGALQLKMATDLVQIYTERVLKNVCFSKGEREREIVLVLEHLCKSEKRVFKRERERERVRLGGIGEVVSRGSRAQVVPFCVANNCYGHSLSSVTYTSVLPSFLSYLLHFARLNSS